ncbi:hypothetical protein O1L55_08405 [Streptomyces albulus]|nr:hypothetical protein [Streptomyces noursei]
MTVRTTEVTFPPCPQPPAVHRDRAGRPSRGHGDAAAVLRARSGTARPDPRLCLCALAVAATALALPAQLGRTLDLVLAGAPPRPAPSS